MNNQFSDFNSKLPIVGIVAPVHPEIPVLWGKLPIEPILSCVLDEIGLKPSGLLNGLGGHLVIKLPVLKLL